MQRKLIKLTTSTKKQPARVLHPSGNLKPSAADEDLTSKIKLASRYHDIKVLDQVIISSEGYCSFADEGLI
ncbi:MAG: JAB domain-containing protein [Ginsengibacter sp.]